MGDAYRLRLSHQLTEFCFFLNVIFATGGGEPPKSGVNNGSTECVLPQRGITYIGSRNITTSGKACQNWVANLPHVINSQITDDRFSDGSKKAARNFCRNPDPKSRTGVWCYTMDAKVEWEYCDVCPGKNYEDYSGCTLSDKGAGYMGRLAHTSSFMDCQPWKDHPNVQFTFPDASVEEAKNYCRNPLPYVYDAPWCFVAGMVDITWEYCDICMPFQGQLTREKGVYKGDHSFRITDMSPQACLRWCLNMGTCVGVNVLNNGSTECLIIPRFAGSKTGDGNYDYYIVQRVCSPKAGGKAAYFVEYPEVLSTGNYVLQQAETDCENVCILKEFCVTYYTNSSNEMCFFHSNIFDKVNWSNPDILSKFIIRCVPSLLPSADVEAQLADLAAELSSQKADNAYGLLKSTKYLTKEPSWTITSALDVASEGTTLLVNANPVTGSSANDAQNETTTPDQKEGGFPMMAIVVVGIVIIIIVAGCVGCFVCYKLGYFKSTEKAKDKDKEKDKSKGKEKRTLKNKDEKKKNEELQKLLPRKMLSSSVSKVKK